MASEALARSQERLDAAYARYPVCETVLAFHEAGHAILNCALGFPPLSAAVCLKPGQPVVALVTSEGTRPQSVLAGCCGLLGGYFAQIKHLGEKEIPGFSSDEIAVQCASDFAKVDEILQSNGFADALTFEILITETKRLVDENWAAIERLAAELLEHGTLNREQIEAAYAQNAGAD